MSELLLNQFEQDRALVALRYKNLNIRKLFGKSVFIAGGGELAFSLVSSLRTVNLKKQAGIAVFLLVEDNESYDRRFDYIDSSDFSIVKYSSLHSVKKCVVDIDGSKCVCLHDFLRISHMRTHSGNMQHGLYCPTFCSMPCQCKAVFPV